MPESLTPIASRRILSMVRIKLSALCVVTLAALFVSLAQGADKAKYPSFGKVVRHDPRVRQAVCQGRAHGEARRRADLVRRAHLDQGRRLRAVLRHPAQLGDEVEGRRRAQPVHAARGLHRRRPLRPRARQQRPADRSARPRRLLRTRRSPHLAARAQRRQENAGRQLPGQAAQQPQRRRVQIERRFVFHRSALRPAREL